MNSTFLALTGFDVAAVEAEIGVASATSSPARRRTPRGKTLHGSVVCAPGDSLLELAFEKAGLLGGVLADGKRAVRCPWEAEHTTGSTFDGSTIVFPPTPGSDTGFFLCSHSHCDGRGLEDVLDSLPGDAVRDAYERVFAKRDLRNNAWTPRVPAKSIGMPSTGAPTPSGTTPAAPLKGSDERYTDVGNAKRLVGTYGEDLRFVHGRGKWLTWDGTRWDYDERGLVVHQAKEAIAQLFVDAGAIADSAERNALINHAMKSEDARRIGAMVQLARSDPRVAVVPARLDEHDWALNVQNGILDLRSGKLLPHDRNLLLTKLAPVVFDPTAQAPTWMNFIDTVFNHDADLISYVQRVSGYALGGWVTAQILVFFYGLGANGKTTYLETLAGVMGDYATQAAPGLLLEKKNDSHPTEIADLLGRRLVISTEVEAGRKLSEALVKQLTGGDKLKGRFMQQDFFEFRPTHSLFLMANHKPVVHGSDEGIWRRMKLVPFTVTIPRAQQDKDLMSKLAAERSGILNWLVQGCLDWQNYGLATSKAVEAATSAYREEMDRMGGFLQDCCVVGAGWAAKSAALYDRYRTWCEKNGDAPVLVRTFCSMLRERGFESKKLHGNAGWKGLRLKNADEIAAAAAADDDEEG